MHEIDMWRGGRVVIAGKGLRQKLEWLIRVDESQPKYTNLNDGSQGDVSDLIMKINREKIGGYEDWRLPDKIELYALKDDPHEPKESIRLWSSSPTKSSEVAWHYCFYSFNGGAPETEPRSTPLPVRLVRSVSNRRDPATDTEEASRWCDSEPDLEGSAAIGIVELIERISAPMLKQHPEVQVRVRRYADDGAIEIFATLDGHKTSCWSENFTRKHSTIGEDFMAMNRAFPERSSIGGGGGWIDRFPAFVDSLVMTVASLLWEIGVHVCDEGDEVFTAFCDGLSREIRVSLPRYSNIHVGSRVFTYGAM